MMIYPPITELVDKVGSRYILVIEAAKRARQLSQGAAPLVSINSNKEVSVATDEIYESKIEVFTRPSIFEERTEENPEISDETAQITETADDSLPEDTDTL